MIVENKKNYVLIWLLLTTMLVALMIIVGGLTRLTDSGLSITKWDLISGIIPPLTANDWEKSFSLYKKIPEYKLLNSSMTIEQFKTIYWWEFSHRFLGRIVGLFYFFPLLFFTWKKIINKKSILILYFIFILILLEGLIGWYMVTSGLSDNTDVSHYRLSLHLTIAFIILILLFWNYLKYKNFTDLSKHKKLPYFLPFFLLFFIIIQISVGALVSGLDAGQIYQSWPLMDQKYFPDDSNFEELFSIKSLETPSLVQFIHRNIAYFIILFFGFIATIIYRNDDFIYLRRTTFLILIFLIFQTFLGILTVVSGAQIILASMHQIGSIFLVTTSLILVFKNSRIS